MSVMMRAQRREAVKAILATVAKHDSGPYVGDGRPMASGLMPKMECLAEQACYLRDKLASASASAKPYVADEIGAIETAIACMDYVRQLNGGQTE